MQGNEQLRIELNKGNEDTGGRIAGDLRSREETPMAPNVSTFPNPKGYFKVGSLAEKLIVLKVRISLRISAAE
jgi:hypothetical protein